MSKGRFVTSETFDYERIICGAMEEKEWNNPVDGSSGKYKSMLIEYKYPGKNDKSVKDKFLCEFPLCKISPPMYSKVAKKFSVGITFDVGTPEGQQAESMFRDVERAVVQFLAERKAIKSKYHKFADEAPTDKEVDKIFTRGLDDKKSPLIRTPKDGGNNHTLYVNLLFYPPRSRSSQKKSKRKSAAKRKSYYVDNPDLVTSKTDFARLLTRNGEMISKPIAWSKLTNMDIIGFPMIHFKSVYKQNTTSLQFVMTSFLIVSLSRRSTIDIQTSDLSAKAALLAENGYDVPEEGDSDVEEEDQGKGEAVEPGSGEQSEGESDEGDSSSSDYESDG